MINTKHPALKETVGAQYICLATAAEDGSFSGTYAAEVERTEVVKNVSVTENADSTDIRASGAVYDTVRGSQTDDISVEVIAFSPTTLANMRGDTVDKSGLILRGGSSARPYFSYGKVVKLVGGGLRFDWYPKCKLTENSDEVATSEESYSEQTDTLTIHAMPFNAAGNVCVSVAEENFPAGLTEEKFFAAPILTPDDLTKAIGA